MDISDKEKPNAEPMEVTVVQLLPDFDGSLEDLMFDEPVSYTEKQLSNLQTEVRIEECVGTTLLHEPSLASAGFISPCVLQKIVDSVDSVESLKPDRDEKAFLAILPSPSCTSLSIKNEDPIQLKDYKISLDSMGGGRLSEVRVAFNETDGNQYAVKILSKKKLQNYNLLLKSRDPLEEANREINILKTLSHPNIITLIEVLEEPSDDNIYIVFELLDRVLMNIPTESPFTETEARKYFRDIVRGVDYLHQHGIVHRDLKPENMLVSKDGVVKIADFGFCEQLPIDSDPDETYRSESQLEEVSAVHGTPAFTPPECLQQKNKPVSGYALDMWSLGVSLYALVIGDVPFKANSIPGLFESINNDSVEFPSNSQPISACMKDLIIKLLDKNPKTRFTMAQVKKYPWLFESENSIEKSLVSNTSHSQENKKVR